MDDEIFSIDSIQLTLKQLNKREPLNPTDPILSLNVLRQRLQGLSSNIDPELVAVYCVYELFEDIMLAKLGRERTNSANALSCLVQDFRSNNQELQAYSLIYYLYLRSDCDLPKKEKLCDLLGIDQRTIRRRVRLGLQHLIFEIIAVERKLATATNSVPIPISKRRMSG